MEFKNIGKVSEHNFRIYKANFINLVSINQESIARRQYELIFTRKEMDYLVRKAFNKKE